MVKWLETTGTESDGQKFWEDNFDDIAAKNVIVPPTFEGTVEELVSGTREEDVYLYRGTSFEVVNAMEEKGSAGGEVADKNARRPTPEDAQSQIRKGRQLAEFTTRPESGWSFNSCLVVVAINTRYLARGSRTEQGWVAYKNAPIEIKAKVDRRVNGESPTRLERANAS